MDTSDDAKIVLVAFFLGVIIGVIMVILFAPKFGEIKSKTVIVPDTIVVTTNGISDTTYIYKERK